MRKIKLSEEDEVLVRCAIDHWARLAELSPLPDEGPWPEDCPLCDEYGGGITCNGCPIERRVNRSCCAGTPYEAASMAWDDWDWAKREGELTQRIIDAVPKACWKELEFLVSLLPEGHQ